MAAKNSVLENPSICGKKLFGANLCLGKNSEIDAALELRKAIINIVLRQADKLAKLNTALEASLAREREKAAHLETAMSELKRAQTQLVQSERMSSLGQLVAAVAYEVNNPINFIYGNLSYAHTYLATPIKLIKLMPMLLN
jgi:Bacteriophytochrome (light-regulated signal transduction histidine kinase)